SRAGHLREHQRARRRRLRTDSAGAVPACPPRGARQLGEDDGPRGPYPAGHRRVPRAPLLLGAPRRPRRRDGRGDPREGRRERPQGPLPAHGLPVRAGPQEEQGRRVRKAPADAAAGAGAERGPPAPPTVRERGTPMTALILTIAVAAMLTLTLPARPLVAIPGGVL